MNVDMTFPWRRFYGRKEHFSIIPTASGALVSQGCELLASGRMDLNDMTADHVPAGHELAHQCKDGLGERSISLHLNKNGRPGCETAGRDDESAYDGQRDRGFPQTYLIFSTL